MHHIVKEIIEFGIVLGIMVLIHELGHFAVAKWCGVRVETFSIGFGTRLFGFRRGDTDYRISVLPLGGYVKMAGDVPGEELSPATPGSSMPIPAGNLHPDRAAQGRLPTSSSRLCCSPSSACITTRSTNISTARRSWTTFQ